MTQQKMTWWEKTVEYTFILQFQRHLKFLSPLEDFYEKGGDTIFNDSNRWILIEFKKDASSVNSEKSKFGADAKTAAVRYKEALKALNEHDNHHVIIYGRIGKNSENFSAMKNGAPLELVCHTYFSDKVRTNYPEMVNHGKNYQDFFNYLEQFTAFKYDKKSGSSGRGLTAAVYEQVACIDADGNVAAMMSKDDFTKGYNLTPSYQPKPPEPGSNTSSYTH